MSRSRLHVLPKPSRSCRSGAAQASPFDPKLQLVGPQTCQRLVDWMRWPPWSSRCREHVSDLGWPALRGRPGRSQRPQFGPKDLIAFFMAPPFSCCTRAKASSLAVSCLSSSRSALDGKSTVMRSTGTSRLTTTSIQVGGSCQRFSDPRPRRDVV